MSLLRVNSIQTLSGTAIYPVPESSDITVTYGVNSGTTTYVYPPAGKAMNQLIGFIPSSRTIYFNGDVDANDSLYCYYTIQASAIEVVCFNNEQRDTPTVNWMAIWSA
jgi:hypothetical protein